MKGQVAAYLLYILIESKENLSDKNSSKPYIINRLLLHNVKQKYRS